MANNVHQKFTVLGAQVKVHKIVINKQKYFCYHQHYLRTETRFWEHTENSSSED